HMTNTRMTDPEVLELRYPVRQEHFSIRHGSGGGGKWHGGDGAIRRIRFLEPMTAVIVASRRNVAPFGLAGGEDGAVGRQWVERADGTHEILTGTSPQHAGNYNAPFAVCQAAVLYVLRTLVGADIPLNEGCLKPVRIVAPEGSMIRPAYPAAVIAGNTEVSQSITEALYRALGVIAGSQGTMNNFVWGNARVQNYETICGGAGAGPNFDGASAVHVHMTNTRMTDPEVLEVRFPVINERFAIRRGSGGAGQQRGGDGVIRALRFLEPMTATILSLNRRTHPHGAAGGADGASGHNYVRRADGRIEELKGNDLAEMQPGDTFVIETPGGGGYGRPG
ncbi:MAG: hydantoinase B/oxoprolinase family protein, partial [Paracoccaceae bacterium]|nr:hydantoinase B/oxoprolinase family protein [Paracoccaceae bacterium]